MGGAVIGLEDRDPVNNQIRIWRREGQRIGFIDNRARHRSNPVKLFNLIDDGCAINRRAIAFLAFKLHIDFQNLADGFQRLRIINARGLVINGGNRTVDHHFSNTGLLI